MKLRDCVLVGAAALLLLAGPLLAPTPTTDLDRLLDQTIARFRVTHPAPAPVAWSLPGLAVLHAQTGVQQTASRLDAATRCDSATGSGSQTLTLQNPGPGYSDYVTFMIANGEETAGLTPASPIAITSSGFNGTSPTFGSVSLLAGAQGTVVGPGPMNFAAPLKANQNAAPTLAGASVTGLTWRFTACYYTAL